jgi:hypothetical protein
MASRQQQRREPDQYDAYADFEPGTEHEHIQRERERHQRSVDDVEAHAREHEHEHDHHHHHHHQPRFLGETNFFEAIQQGPGLSHLGSMDEHALTTLFTDQGDGQQHQQQYQPGARGGGVYQHRIEDDLGAYEINDNGNDGRSGAGPSRLQPSLSHSQSLSLSHTFNLDPALDPALDPSLGTGPSANPDPIPNKRKATSRANMLVRGGACDYCKKGRIKCSAEEPSCAACLRAGKECIYMQKKQKSKVKVLQERLAELEGKLGTKVETESPGESASMRSEEADKGGAAGKRSRGYGDEEDKGKISNALVARVGSSAVEPDLMTLADAAAGDPNRGLKQGGWEKMTPEMIGDEIIQAVNGVKGIGEKIVSHL